MDKSSSSTSGHGSHIEICLSRGRSYHSLLPHCRGYEGQRSSDIVEIVVRATPIITSLLLALTSMFGFGAGFVLTQFGLRWMQPWLGVAISIPSSTLLFWCLAPFFADPRAGDLNAVV